MSAPKAGSPQNQNPTLRLEQLLADRRFIAYEENLPDKEYPFVLLSIYGAPETNELFLKLTNGKVTFVEAFESGLIFPPMADRIFGLDAQDADDAYRRAEQLWEKHKDELVRA